MQTAFKEGVPLSGIPQTRIVRDIVSAYDGFETNVVDDYLFFQLEWYAVAHEAAEATYRASWEDLHWVGVTGDKQDESAQRNETDTHT